MTRVPAERAEPGVLLLNAALSVIVGDGGTGMDLLSGLTVAQIGSGLAAAVCGRMFADLGSTVLCIGADHSTPLAAHLNAGKDVVEPEALSRADLIVCQDGPGAASIRDRNATAPLVTISPFG